MVWCMYVLSTCLLYIGFIFWKRDSDKLLTQKKKKKKKRKLSLFLSYVVWKLMRIASLIFVNFDCNNFSR